MPNVDLTNLMDESDLEISDSEETDESLGEEIESSEEAEESEEVEEEVGEEEEIVEEEEEEKAKIEVKKTKEVERKVKEDVKRIIDLIGKDATLKTKGLEAKLEDFTPEEVKAFLNKGLRFYQAMEENARMSEQNSEKEAALARALRQVEEMQLQVSRQLPGQALVTETTMPKDLEISEEDDPTVASLKKVAQAQWQMNQKLSEQVNAFRGGFEKQGVQEAEQALVREIEQRRTDYPLASLEETLAVHFLSKGSIPVSKIMEKGQQYYGNVKFVQKIFQHCPDVRKAIFDEMTKEYLAKQNKASKKRVTIRSPGAATKTVSFKGKSPQLTFDNVGKVVQEYIKERERIDAQEED